MKYKIVFVDIDGTLLYDNNPIGEKTKDIMKKLKEMGILLVVNSGRDCVTATKKSIEGNLSNYVISSNGAEIYDREKNKIIMERSLPMNVIEKIYEYASLHNMTMWLNTIEKQYQINNKQEIEQIKNSNQIVLTSNNYERMIAIPNLFKEKFKEVHLVHSSLSLIEKKRIKDSIYYHDIVLSETTKATGIAELLDYLHISPDDALAIGNGYDDLPMKEVVKTFIAMENSPEEIKKYADFIAPSVKEEGVASILEEIFFK